jgi:hypothetical protein
LSYSKITNQFWNIFKIEIYFRVSLTIAGKGKPVARQGRKATGSAAQIAWLPIGKKSAAF